MTNVQKLVYSFIEFLEDQKQLLDAESVESLDVATQCLEAAYGLDQCETDQLRVPMKLADIFNEAVGCMPEEDDFTLLNPEVTPEAQLEADRLKAQGNEFMKSERFEEALDAYSKAIELDPFNAVYYCNRAAAYSKLEKHKLALRDCDRALKIQPDYGKAFGRKGLAHSALNEHEQAITCYTRALELDPDNQSYRNNMDVSKQKLTTSPSQGPEVGGAGNMPSFGGMDMSQLMNNPQIMRMAQNFMSNPQMQQVMTNLVGNLGGSNDSDGAGQMPDMSAFLRVGQQFAQQFQQSNPELVEEIRRQAAGSNPEPPPSGTEKPEDQG